MLKKIGSIVQIWPEEGASCKIKGSCTECNPTWEEPPGHRDMNVPTYARVKNECSYTC